MIAFVFLIGIAIVCAILAVRASHLLHAALLLAGVSAAVSLMLFLVGAYTMAVIELSLSVGLITILLVFAISMVGAASPDHPKFRRTDTLLLLALLVLLVSLSVPLLPSPPPPEGEAAAFSAAHWGQREADVFAQTGLIFSGVLGVLGLLTEGTRKIVRAYRPRVSRSIEPDRPASEIEREAV